MMDRCKKCNAILVTVYRHGLCQKCRKIELFENKPPPPSIDEYIDSLITELSNLRDKLATLKSKTKYIQSAIVKKSLQTNLLTLENMARKIRNEISDDLSDGAKK